MGDQSRLAAVGHSVLSVLWEGIFPISLLQCINKGLPYLILVHQQRPRKYLLHQQRPRKYKDKRLFLKKFQIFTQASTSSPTADRVVNFCSEKINFTFVPNSMIFSFQYFDRKYMKISVREKNLNFSSWIQNLAV